MVKSGPALTAGGVLLTVTVTASCEIHPLLWSTAVRVYVVDVVGLATGLVLVVGESPAVVDQV